MTISHDDNAVSPVIGVILMVAITVILATIIMAFVFGMAGNIQKMKVVAVSSRHVGNEIVITYNGGQDQYQVDSLIATINGIDAGHLGRTVGSTVSKSGYPTKVHVIIAAKFNDGTDQVISDAWI